MSSVRIGYNDAGKFSDDVAVFCVLGAATAVLFG